MMQTCSGAPAHLFRSRLRRGLAILLQEMEGYFYNGVIAPALQDRFPDGDWFIVYDAVFASSEISEEVHSLLNELCLGHFGVKDLFSL